MKRPTGWFNNRCADLGICNGTTKNTKGTKLRSIRMTRSNMKLRAALLTFALMSTICYADSVSDLVAQIPVTDSAAESALAAKLMAAGPAALKELCERLVPLGTDKKDDTQTRD